MDVLVRRVGEGVTGHVAATGKPLITGDAANCEYGGQIDGTEAIEESLIAVPLSYGARVVGVIVISKLGLDQFDADDLRLLEVLAGHASVALVNARLYEAQRREAESAKALLELARELSSVTELGQVADRLAERGRRILGSAHASVWLRRGRRGRPAAGCSSDTRSARQNCSGSRSTSAPCADGATAPYIIAADYEQVDIRRAAGTGSTSIAPFTIDGRPGIDLRRGLTPDDYGERELELLGGIANQAKLAVSNASRSASSSGRSSPRSRRSPTRSRRRTSTRSHTPAGSPTCRCASGRSSASTGAR